MATKVRVPLLFGVLLFGVLVTCLLCLPEQTMATVIWSEPIDGDFPDFPDPWDGGNIDPDFVMPEGDSTIDGNLVAPEITDGRITRCGERFQPLRCWQ